MIKKLFLLPMFTAFFFAFPIDLAYAKPNAYEILKESSIMGSAEKVIYRADMEIFSSRGSKSRKIEIYKEESGNDSYKLLAQVVFPTFLRDMKLLMISENGQDARWMKTSRGVRSIADSGRTEQIFDSDLDTDDLANINIDNYTLTLQEETYNSYIINAVEKSTSNRRLITIDRTMNIISSIEYIDTAGRIYKDYQLLETKILDGVFFPKESIISRPLNNTYTVLTFTSIELPSSIPARMFNRHQL